MQIRFSFSSISLKSASVFIPGFFSFKRNLSFKLCYRSLTPSSV
jgi:hypothetical protein